MATQPLQLGSLIGLGGHARMQGKSSHLAHRVIERADPIHVPHKGFIRAKLAAKERHEGGASG